MHETAWVDIETALEAASAGRLGVVGRVAAARTAQKELLAQLVELRAQYARAHRAYCATYAAARGEGVRESVLTGVDCPPLDPRHDPFLHDGYFARGKPA
ncbi:MAG TPA: hypothetical protein VGE11_13625 [Pseudonocardia sp.]